MKELALHLLDLVENSANAGASSITVTVMEDLAADRLRFIVLDDGCGMNADLVKRIRDPFTTTQKKRTGLGIPFLCQSAEICGGSVEIQSEPGSGTKVDAVWQHSHWDRAPLGQMDKTITAFFTMPCRVRFRHIVYDSNGRNVWEIDLDSDEFGGPPLDAGTLQALQQYLKEQYQSLRKGRGL